MKGTLVLTLLGAILCNVELASAQTGAPYYHCANNSMQGSSGPPQFQLDGDTWKPTLDETTAAGSKCSGNVETGNFPTCNSSSVSLSNTSISSVVGGAFESEGESVFSFLPLCAIPRGECNVALASRTTVSAGTTCSGTGIWTQIEATDTSFSYDYDDDINVTGCDTDTSVDDYCVRFEVGYASACEEDMSEGKFTPAIQYEVRYSGLCSESQWVVNSSLATFFIDANTVAQGAITNTGSFSSDTWDTDDVTFTFESSDLDAPTFYDAANNQISVVEDGVEFTIRQNVKIEARTALQASCTATVTNMDSGMEMNAGDLSSSECNSLQIGDCFDLSIESSTHDCGGSADYSGLQDMTFDDGGNYWNYTYGSGVDCSGVSEELCCLSFELNLAVSSTPSDGCASANGDDARRLSSPNARYLEDSNVDENQIAKLVHTIHVVRAGDVRLAEQVPRRSAGNNKSDSGVAGWIPAAGVGGLLLLAGAVIAVTRRPSLLRGAFHGPTKVLPNEEK